MVLSDDEQAVLTARARSVRGAHRDRLRARIVLAAATGKSNAAIAAHEGGIQTRPASGGAGSRPPGWRD